MKRKASHNFQAGFDYFIQTYGAKSEKFFYTSTSTYSFGFNGMMKDNNIYGQGNAYTTEFREYDVRLGNWMTRDPKAKAYESPYVGFSDNPIYFSDPAGDDPDPPTTHTVKKGETLSGIAKANGLKTSDLVAANSKISDPNKIYPGQNVNIPSATASNNTANTSGAQSAMKSPPTNPSDATSHASSVPTNNSSASNVQKNTVVEFSKSLTNFTDMGSAATLLLKDKPLNEQIGKVGLGITISTDLLPLLRAGNDADIRNVGSNVAKDVSVYWVADAIPTVNVIVTGIGIARLLDAATQSMAPETYTQSYYDALHAYESNPNQSNYNHLKALEPYAPNYGVPTNPKIVAPH